MRAAYASASDASESDLEVVQLKYSVPFYKGQTQWLLDTLSLNDTKVHVKSVHFITKQFHLIITILVSGWRYALETITKTYGPQCETVALLCHYSVFSSVNGTHTVLYIERSQIIGFLQTGL